MATENFSWLLLDGDSNPIINANPTPTMRIRRRSDNHILDWADMIFKASGWVAPRKTFTEINPVNFEGVYEIDLPLETLSGKYFAYSNFDNETGKQAVVSEFNVVLSETRSVLQPLLTIGDKADIVSDVLTPVTSALDAVEVKVDRVVIDTSELHAIHGLDSANPMTVTPSSRVSGGITQTITGDQKTTNTVSRV